jgi:hypothetical protein
MKPHAIYCIWTFPLAKLSGLNQGRLSLMVNKKIEPTQGERKKLEQFFEIPASDLLEEVTND